MQKIISKYLSQGKNMIGHIFQLIKPTVVWIYETRSLVEMNENKLQTVFAKGNFSEFDTEKAFILLIRKHVYNLCTR